MRNAMKVTAITIIRNSLTETDPDARLSSVVLVPDVQRLGEMATQSTIYCTAEEASQFHIGQSVDLTMTATASPE